MAKPKLEPFLWILTHYFFLVNLAWRTPSVDFLLSPHRGKHLWESLLALGEPTCPHNLSSHLFSSFIHPFSRLDISLEVKAFHLVLSRHLHLLSPGTKPVSDWAHHPISLLVLAICPSTRSKSFLRAFLCYSSNPSSLSALPICCPKQESTLSSSSALSFPWSAQTTCLSPVNLAICLCLFPLNPICTLHYSKLLKTQVWSCPFSAEVPIGPYCDSQDPLWSGPCFPHQPQGPAS